MAKGTRGAIRPRTDPRVQAATAAHGRSPEAVLAVLRSAQEANGYLDTNALGATTDALRLNDAHVYGVASFYSMLSIRPRKPRIVRLCDGPVCELSGAEAVRQVLFGNGDSEWTVERSSCLGLCDRAPAALAGREPCGPLTAANAREALRGWRGAAPVYSRPRSGEVRVAMARLGRIDPDSIDSAIAAGAYQALGHALIAGAETVLEAVEHAGLRGCGGAGFGAARKWRMARDAEPGPRYVICNADESEPGAFKDRVLMEGDPHLLLEGMALAGYAVGASAGTIYIRGEYDGVAGRLERAIRQAEARGWLGKRIRGTDFSFDVDVHRGAGAYICGEETALLNSLEGRRGEPRLRPPYPTTRGYRGLPTVVNNVETLCRVPAIVGRGADWFRSFGTADSPGTKVFTVTGRIRRPGAFEAPFGITLRQVIEQFGGGMAQGASFKAALTGGAAGSFVPAALLDVPLDFDSWKSGVILGSGAVVVLDASVSMPQFLRCVLEFFEKESCGKCTPCREGTRAARQIAERMAAGTARHEDVAELRRLARQMNLTSLCGLGQSAAWPIESALLHFGAEFGAG